MCSASGSSSTTPASSASVHCQSAVPAVQKSYAGHAVVVEGRHRERGRLGGVDHVPRVDAGRRRGGRGTAAPNGSRDSRAASDTGWPSRPRPTATLSGLPPGWARKRRSPSATRSTIASPSTVSMRGHYRRRPRRSREVRETPAADHQTAGGRSSYGVESTTVVRVETLARDRISCSSDLQRARPLDPHLEDVGLVAGHAVAGLDRGQPGQPVRHVVRPGRRRSA